MDDMELYHRRHNGSPCNIEFTIEIPRETGLLELHTSLSNGAGEVLS
jgi:hypothetical protein